MRGVNLLDGGAPFYTTYETADGKYLAVGALEPHSSPSSSPSSAWTTCRRSTSRRRGRGCGICSPAPSLTRTRDEWAAAFESVDGCVAPVLDLAEAPDGAHLAARGTFTEAFGVVQPAPAPRLSRTPGRIRSAPPNPGTDSREVLSDWGFDKAEIDALIAQGTVAEDAS